MRISDSAKRTMKNDILEDLYRKAEDELRERAGTIAQKNRIYELEPYQAIIDTLPVNLIAHTKDYKVNIQYKRDEDGNHALDEKWTHYYDKPVPAFIEPHSSGYSNINNTAIVGKLDPRLHTEAAKLAEDMLAIRQEKRELFEYLDETLEEWSGPKQLKTVWPESLHKYLPVSKPRTRRDPTDKPPVPKAAAAPTGLGTRLTNNLLEGS